MMDYKELIESGKLELYALGALDLQDQKEIETLLASDAELKVEYDAIADALGVYGQSTSDMPSLDILERAKAQITAEENTVNTAETKVIPMGEAKSTNTTKWWAVAASVMLLASVGLNLKLNSDLNEVQEDYVALESQNQMMAANTVKFNESNIQTNEMIASLASGKMQRTYIGSTENYDGYESAVYWDKASSEVIIATNNLPTLSETEQYQLWAIVDGKPVDAGVFDASTRLAKMKGINGEAVAFAVTIEPKGGSVNPTMEKMVMIGNVSS
jgi:anti-sigma-K factor RskA